MPLIHEQTILKMNEIYVQFHCLSSYWNESVYKRLCIETTSFPPDPIEVAAFTGLKILRPCDAIVFA